MRLPRLFFSLMLPLVGSAISFPNQFAALFGDPENPAVTAAAKKKAEAVALGIGTLRIPADKDGHYRVIAKIGARQVPFLVDTGATQVALSWNTARDLGLVHPGDPMDLQVNTANGVAKAKAVTMSRVDLDSLSVSNVPAMVMPEGAMNGNLLGMSFLTKLKRFEVARNTLVMEQ